MAKRSYLSFYKKGDRAGMRGIMAGETQKTGSVDPEVSFSKENSARLRSDAIGDAAYKWWRRQMINPRTGEVTVIGENMPFEDFKDFYDFYSNEALNPYEKPSGAKGVSEGGLGPAVMNEMGDPARASVWSDLEATQAGKPVGVPGNRGKRQWRLKDAEFWHMVNPRGKGGKREIKYKDIKSALNSLIAARVAELEKARGAGQVAAPGKPADYVEGVDEERARLQPYVDKGLLRALNEKDWSDIASMKGTPYADSMIWKLFGGHDKYDEATAALEKINNPSIKDQIMEAAPDLTADEVQQLIKRALKRKALKAAIQQNLDKQTELRLSDVKITPDLARDGYTSIKGGHVHEVPADKHKNGQPYKSPQEEEAARSGFRKTIVAKPQKYLENRDSKETKEILAIGGRAGTANKGLPKKEVPEGLMREWLNAGMTEDEVTRAWNAGLLKL